MNPYQSPRTEDEPKFPSNWVRCACLLGVMVCLLAFNCINPKKDADARELVLIFMAGAGACFLVVKLMHETSPEDQQ